MSEFRPDELVGRACLNFCNARSSSVPLSRSASLASGSSGGDEVFSGSLCSFVEGSSEDMERMTISSIRENSWSWRS